MCNCKGNPVPSLSFDLAKKYAEDNDHYCDHDRYASIRAFIRWYNEKHGVETNKEQVNECSLCIPKCEGCSQQVYDEAYKLAVKENRIKTPSIEEWYENKPII
jgi:hypothetical protein